MENHTFRTHVRPSDISACIRPESYVFGIGSCFAASIGNELTQRGFDTCINPFGVVYNPASIAAILERCHSRKEFDDDDIQVDGDHCFSYLAHGTFNRATANECKDCLNATLSRADHALRRADVLIITLGTSFVYKLNKTNEIVANCHKQPQKEFTRELLDVDAAFDTLHPPLQTLMQLNPGLSIILTVSPVRHLRDDPHENQISKSHLLILADKLCGMSSAIHYFPAYETMMDDLRDYRFYADDMIHPSKLAVNYIWDAFKQWCFTAEAKELVSRVDEIMERQNHRPRDPDSLAHKDFLNQTEELERQLSLDFPDNFGSGFKAGQASRADR